MHNILGTDKAISERTRVSGPMTTNDPRPKVAVITRTRNRPLLLSRAAVSVGAQRLQDFDWLIVNDGGKEEEIRAVLAKHRHLFSRTRLISQPNQGGMESASNIGVRGSQSDYIAIHDDDDTWDPEFLARTTEFLESTEGASFGGVVSRANYVSEEIIGHQIIEHGRWVYRVDLESVDLAAMIRSNLFPPISFLFRRNVYEAIGGFDESLPVLGDWAFNLEFLLRADIAVIPDILANYHHRDRMGATSGAYANSVSASALTHRRYLGTVRNRFIRRNMMKEASALVATLGFVIDEQQREMQIAGLARINSEFKGKTSNRPFDPAHHQQGFDLIWTILHVMHFFYRKPIRGVFARLLLLPPLKLTAPWNDVLACVRRLKMSIPPPPDFNEEVYLAEYRDVAAAVAAGKQPSAYMHYIFFGRTEGRDRPGY